MKVLNLYAGIGGNRKLWEGVEVTAVEMNPKIAEIYQDFFPNDNVVVGDAHEYLEKNFEEFDFIWTSPPCPSHSKIRNVAGVGSGQNRPIYPDMKLYQEIIFLQQIAHSSGTAFKGKKYCVENVISYYKPLIPPQERARHYFWANFFIGDREYNTQGIQNMKDKDNVFGFSLDKYDIDNKKQILRNLVNPALGLHILNESKRVVQPELFQ